MKKQFTVQTKASDGPWKDGKTTSRLDLARAEVGRLKRNHNQVQATSKAEYGKPLPPSTYVRIIDETGTVVYPAHRL